MHYQIHTKTAEEYLNDFSEQPAEVGKVIGLTTFTTVYKVILALKNNYIAMDDTRSNLGKLHCITNTASIESTGIAVSHSTDPGALSFEHLVLAEARDTHLVWCTT
jgi:hypothetical protein